MTKGTILVTAASEIYERSDIIEKEVLSKSLASWEGLGWTYLVAVRPGLGPKIDKDLSRKFRDLNVVEVPAQCKGALATAMYSLTSTNLDFSSPLIVTAGNSGFSELSIAKDLSFFETSDVDVGIFSVLSTDPKMSYIQEGRGQITFIAEKSVVGRYATTGSFYFRNGSSFIDGANWVLVSNARVEDRFFVSTVVNFALMKSQKVMHSAIDSRFFWKVR